MLRLKDEYGITGLGILALVICIVVVLLLIIIALSTVTTYFSCRNFIQLNQDFEVQWSFWNGCMVKNAFGLWVNRWQITTIQGELVP